MERYIVTNKDRITQTDTYLVRLDTADGKTFENLEPRRIFPYTFRNEYVSLLNSDEKEEALIPSLAELDSESREALELCLKEYYMVPRIVEILNIEDSRALLRFRVRTERGVVKFQIQNRHSDIKERNGVMFIRDSNDNRYRIDIALLDEKNYKKILAYI